MFYGYYMVTEGVLVPLKTQRTVRILRFPPQKCDYINFIEVDV